MSKSLRMLGAISVATLIGSALVAADPKNPEMVRPKAFDDVVANRSPNLLHALPVTTKRLPRWMRPQRRKTSS
jgi:hypothetical protein